MDFNNPFRTGSSLVDAVKVVFEKNERVEEQKPLEPVKIGKKKDKVDVTPSIKHSNEEVEHVEEKLAHPNHAVLDIAKPKDNLTAADFKALRAGKTARNKGISEEETEKNLHNYATSVYSEQWGYGTTVKTMRADPDEQGNITWYDVMFDHGLEKQVPVTEMKILASEAHSHKKM